MSIERKQITVSQILTMLEDGKDRVAIKAELGLTGAEMSLLFSHPKLKNQKPKRPVSFELVDDTIDETQNLGSTSLTEEVKDNTSISESTIEEAVAPEPVAVPTVEVSNDGVW